MPLQISPFQLPSRPQLTPQNLAALPKMGPPDMVEANMKGIAGLGTAFEGAYERARERGAMDQLSEYYKTHPFAQGAAAPPGVSGVSGVSGAADSPAPGAAPTGGHLQSGQAVYQGLVDRGIEPHVAAGMAGNVYTESRFNAGALGDRDKQTGQPTAIGYAQWRGTRQQGLFAAAQARGTDWRDPEAQLDHMAAELKGTYAKVYRAAVASGNPGAATAILARGYEAPADWAFKKTIGERTAAAQSIFALGQRGGGGGPLPPPDPRRVAAADAPAPGARPQSLAVEPVVGGGVSAPPPVGLPPPDPTPDNVANAKAILQQPTSDPPLKAWAGEVLRKAPGAAGQVPTAPPPQQQGAFTIPSTGEQVPVGQGPDRLNAGAPPPQQAGGPPGGPIPPAAAPPLPPPDPRRVAAAANAPAPGAVPTQFQPSGGDSTYAATADYAGAQRAGLVPPATMGPGAGSMPSAAPPGAQQPGPATTGSLPPPAAAAPAQGAPAGPPPGQDPRLPAAQAAGNARANEMVEGIAAELVKRGMDPKEARVRAAGATWDDKGFRLGPYPNPAAEKALAAGGAGPAPAASPAAGGGGGPTAAPAAAPGGGGAPQLPRMQPTPTGAIVTTPQGKVFMPNEALAIAARGNPQVFAAMLREYGPQSGKGFGFIESGGVIYRTDSQGGTLTPMTAPQTGGGETLIPPGDPRREGLGIKPGDTRTYKTGTDARGRPTIDPVPDAPAPATVDAPGGGKAVWNPQAGRYEPLVIPGQDGKAPMFNGNSVEGQALNHLVTSGVISPAQAADLATGKVVTLPNGQQYFFRGTELLGLPPAGTSVQPAVPGPGGPAPAPAGPAQPPAGPVGPAPVQPAPAPVQPAPAPAAPPGQRGTPLGPPKELPPVTADTAARLQLGETFLDAYLEPVKKIIGSGWLSTPVGRGQLLSGKYGDGGQVYRWVDEGSEGLVRVLTGAGMPESEAARYRTRYMPSATDGQREMTAKIDQLERILKRTVAVVKIGHQYSGPELEQLRADDRRFGETYLGERHTRDGAVIREVR